MMNIKRILCPTDLTTHSKNAMRYALALSRAHEAELVLLYCNTTGTPKVPRRSEVELGLLKHIDASDLVDVRWRLLVAYTDDVGEEITHQAQIEGIDLI